MDEYSVRLILMWITGFLCTIAYCVGIYHIFIQYKAWGVFGIAMPLWPFIEGVVQILRGVGVAV